MELGAKYIFAKVDRKQVAATSVSCPNSRAVVALPLVIAMQVTRIPRQLAVNPVIAGTRDSARCGGFPVAHDQLSKCSSCSSLIEYARSAEMVLRLDERAPELALIRSSSRDTERVISFSPALILGQWCDDAVGEHKPFIPNGGLTLRDITAQANGNDKKAVDDN